MRCGGGEGEVGCVMWFSHRNTTLEPAERRHRRLNAEKEKRPQPLHLRGLVL